MAACVKDVVPVLQGGDRIILSTMKGDFEYNKILEGQFGDVLVDKLSFNWDKNAWVIRLKEGYVKAGEKS